MTTEIDNLKTHEADAFGLVRATLALDQARDNIRDLALALDHNLQIWSAIDALISSPENGLSDPVKKNLHRLAEFVSAIILRHGATISGGTLDTLININLQISEGLLESAGRKE
jgi:flagellar biosynthesis regulator FlaF